MRNLILIKRSRDLLQKELASQNEDLAELTQQLVASRQELQRNLEALRTSEGRWRAIFENSAVGIALGNPDGAFTVTNRAYQRMLGYTGEELQSLSFLDITYEGDREANWALSRDLREGRVPQFRYEKRYRRKDGRLIWVRTTVSLAPGSETVPRFAMAIVEDITERKQAEEALRRSQMMFEKLFDSSPDAIVASDLQGRIARVSEQTEKIFGYKRNELLGQPVEVLLPKRSRRVHAAHRGNYYAQPRVRPMGAGLELHGRRQDGTEFPVDILLSLIETEEGPLVLSVVRDITERKQAEERLREYEKVVEGLEEMIVVVDREYRYRIAKRAFLNYRGLDQEQVVGHSIAELVNPDVFEKVAKKKVSECFQGKVVRYELRYKYPKLGERDLFISYFPIEGPGGVNRAACILQDITERKRSEEELQRSFDQLRALTAQLQNVREEERTVVAREIHDELGQALTAIKLDVTALVRELPTENGPAIQRSQRILKLLDETIQSVQRISTDLRPGILDDLGLAAALEWAAEEFEARTGTKCRMNMSEDDITTDPDRATALFRIFQEILTNVARHAKATAVNVWLGKENGNLALEVHDNGVGIREERLSAGESLGILGMRERTRLLGGEFTIRGIPGAGTTVRVRIPLAEPRAAVVAQRSGFSLSVILRSCG